MGEINLLPDELRDKEEKELKSIRKKSKRIQINMSSPKRDVTRQPLKRSRPSLMSRLFDKKTKPGAKIAAAVKGAKPKNFDTSSRSVEKTIHIPKVTDGGRGLSLPNVSRSSGVGVSKKDTEEVNDDRASSFISDEDGGSEKVKISKRSEKIIENIEKSPKQKKGFFLKLFSRDRASKKKNDKSVDSTEQKKSSRLKLGGDDGERDTVLDVNLIPEELNKHPELEIGKKLFASGIVVAIFSSLIAAGYFGIIWYQLNLSREAEKIEKEVQVVNQQIKELEVNGEEAREFQEYLALVKQILEGHIYWSKFFEKFEEHTSKEVYFTNFSMAGTEKLTITSVARDYQSIAEQLVTFQEADDFVKDVRINSATASLNTDDGSYEGVNFTINLEFIPGLFLKKIDLP